MAFHGDRPCAWRTIAPYSGLRWELPLLMVAVSSTYLQLKIERVLSRVESAVYEKESETTESCETRAFEKKRKLSLRVSQKGVKQ